MSEQSRHILPHRGTIIDWRGSQFFLSFYVEHAVCFSDTGQCRYCMLHCRYPRVRFLLVWWQCKCIGE